jgi:hypothetical protein
VKLTKLELDQAAIDLENKEKEVVAAEAPKASGGEAGSRAADIIAMIRSRQQAS